MWSYDYKWDKIVGIAIINYESWDIDWSPDINYGRPL